MNLIKDIDLGEEKRKHMIISSLAFLSLISGPIFNIAYISRNRQLTFSLELCTVLMLFPMHASSVYYILWDHFKEFRKSYKLVFKDLTNSRMDFTIDSSRKQSTKRKSSLNDS